MNANLFAQLQRGFGAANQCAIEVLDPPAGAPTQVSWGDIDRSTAQIAHLLKSHGLERDARVAIHCEKSVEGLLLYLGCLRAGAVALPLNQAYQSSELDYFIGNARPSIVVCSPKSERWMREIAERHGVRAVYTLGDDRSGSLWPALSSQPDTAGVEERGPNELAAILYTSGTTGRSKGAMLTHHNLWSNAKTLHTLWRWRSSDVLLHMLPIFHVHGLFVACHGALLAGAKILWMNRFDAASAVKALPRATVMMGVPTLYVRLLDQAELNAEACRTMRLFISGSAPLLPDTFQQFETRTGHRILERYGMSETVMLTSNSVEGHRIAGTVGQPLPEVQVRLVDDAQQTIGVEQTGVIGAIQVKGPNVFTGYWEMPEKTAEEFTQDGFFKTGDMGQWDANGYLSIVGRNKDLIISGGYNVYPKEVEGVLDTQPEILESAVVGIAHRDFGEAVAAALVLKPGKSIDQDELVARLKKVMAGFKVPRRFMIVTELPRNAMGKVQKNLLRDQLAGCNDQ
jgi:malonyl-CoA/methylmalonyl-CoA synthetase